MLRSIENTLKDAGFTDAQVRVLDSVFEKAQTSSGEKNLSLEVGEIKGRITMLAWTVGILAAVFLGVGTLLYQRVTSVETSLNQRITSVETSLNQRIDDLKEDVSENRAMMQKVLEKLDQLED